jgi:hypothetical protein
MLTERALTILKRRKGNHHYRNYRQSAGTVAPVFKCSWSLGEVRCIYLELCAILLGYYRTMTEKVDEGGWMRAAKSNIGNSRLARLELEFQIRGGGG